MSVGRIAPEKNLEAFLIADAARQQGRDRARAAGGGAARALPACAFSSAALSGEQLAAHVAAADVFVFPSKTDTFGIVQLEALASGVPVAAFPVTGPKDVIGDARWACSTTTWRACLRALGMSRRHAGACAAIFLGSERQPSSSTM